jgi:pimeloyl-ACP methyl ester carboxylesterase
VLAALLVVGSLALHPCGGAPQQYYCGTFVRPLDPSGSVSGTISIGFTWLPHRLPGPTGGTIVAAEGGPGYPSGASRSSYRQLFGPLLDRRDLLMMDDRGTGRSGAIDCEPLQRAPVMILMNVTRCGRELGDRADLYGSALAADDLAALMSALGIRDACFYGDSYGTFFVQVFAARHPRRVRSIVLDGAYPAIGADPWYPSTGRTIRDAFDIVCRRSPACAALPGSSSDRLAALARTLRRPPAPISLRELALIADSAGLNPIAYRELDAAARAYLEGDDAAPLLRLARETDRYEEAGGEPPDLLSQGLFAAASCSDNPQAYDMRLSIGLRQRAWHRALRSKERTAPNLYAPFTIPEFLGMPLDYSYVPLCQTWPVASAAHPAGQPIPAGARMPNVPALVLTGDLDTITTPSEGDAATALFRNARHVIVQNTGHVTAIDDEDRCASVIVRRFLRGLSYDSECTASIPPVRLVPNFARLLSAVPPATPIGSHRWNPTDLRIAADAVFAASDALYRVQAYDMTIGNGLRGGTFAASSRGDRLRITLHGVQWTDDLPVSGNLTYYPRTETVVASLLAHGIVLHANWRVRAYGANATITGTIRGTTGDATMPAP